MRDAILDFHTQFSYDPKIENSENFTAHKKFIVLGMGGSHWAADLIKTWNPFLDIAIHANYGLPLLPDDILKNSLIIGNSYSGNTEETLDGFRAAFEQQFSVFVISTGGTLIDFAKAHSISYIQMPNTGIQPRSALGFNMRALLKAMGEERAITESSDLATTLEPASLEEAGKTLAGKLKGKIPVIYASHRNTSLANIWKIKFNETGKIPAFANVFPELNHNEMTGFDVTDTTRDLAKNFYFVLLKDAEDHPQIQKRMVVLEKLYLDRGLSIEAFNLEGSSWFQKAFFSLVLADWAAYYTAEGYGVESEQVPMVEEFKKLIR